MWFVCVANRRTVSGIWLRLIDQFIQLAIICRVDIHAWIVLLFDDVGGGLTADCHTRVSLYFHMVSLLCRYSLGVGYGQYFHFFISRERRFNWCISWFVLTLVIILASCGYWWKLILLWFFIHNYIWSVKSMCKVLYWSTEPCGWFIFLIIENTITRNSSCNMAFNNCLTLALR